MTTNPTISLGNIRQPRPTPIRLGTSYVARFDLYVNDGSGQVLKGGLPGISLATLSIYNANGSLTAPLTAAPMNILTVTNGQQLLITLSTAVYPLTAAGEWIGEIVATRNGVPSEVRDWFFNTVELANLFGSDCDC